MTTLTSRGRRVTATGAPRIWWVHFAT